MSWKFWENKSPKRQVKATDLLKKPVKPAPVDPTLDSVAKETSERIQEKAREIKTLSDDIVSMTDGLLLALKANRNEHS